MELEFEEIPTKIVPENIRDILVRLYPGASQSDIDQYEELIRLYDTEKLPPTKEALEYKAISKKVKELTDEKDKLRDIVLQQFKDLGHQIGELSISSYASPTYNQDKLYDWATKHLTLEQLEFVTEKSISDKRFEALIAKKIINTKDLPEDLYLEKKEVYKVNLDEPRSKKK